VEVTEDVYQRGSRRVRPLCERLGVDPGGYSRGLEQAVVDFGAEDSFALAAKRLGRHHPVRLSAGTVRKITLRHAAEMARMQKPEGCLSQLPAMGVKDLVVEADGTMLPVVEFTSPAPSSGDKRKARKTSWREMRLCAAKDPQKADARYACDMDGVHELGQRWSHCAGKAGWGMKSRLHAVSDGATWIGLQVKACLGENAAHLLDLYHVMEYLAAAQKACGPWNDPRKRWLKVQKQRLLKNQSAKVIDELSSHLEPPGREDTPVRDAWRYLCNHRDQLDYKTARERDLPVGSGLIESAHRHVLQKRLKLSGAWWTASNLDHMAQLRTCRANNDWDDYWNAAA
jgi:hypothetical protein